jgi:hypothetical protein
MFGLFGKKTPRNQFPPVPKWRPAIEQPLERIVDRIRYYTNNKRDFAVFRYGTCVLLEDDLSDSQAVAAAKGVLHDIFQYHPDFKPLDMDDGNVLVTYNHPAVNVVLDDIAASRWSEIDANHQKALATSEVLITPLGNNVFDDFGKKALFGRCFMFMDAQEPQVVRIERKGT